MVSADLRTVAFLAVPVDVHTVAFIVVSAELNFYKTNFQLQSGICISDRFLNMSTTWVIHL